MMKKHLAELRAKRAAGESGFTLIELLVVVVIIGILIAIAIPVYLNYQKGAKDKSAASDLRNAVGVLEQCNSDNNAYPSAMSATGNMAATGVTNPCSQQINVTAGTQFLYTYTAGTNGAAASYMLASMNQGGKPTYYCYNSTKGGSVQSVPNATSLAAATC